MGQSEHDAEADEQVCGDYPEHDWELFDEADGERIYHCRRCGAESEPETVA